MLVPFTLPGNWLMIITTCLFAWWKWDNGLFSWPLLIAITVLATVINKNTSPESIVELDQLGKPHYYAPILFEKKCLMCHGTVDRELTKKADSIIKSFYPNDLATGFSEGDLRGIWSISFP